MDNQIIFTISILQINIKFTTMYITILNIIDKYPWRWLDVLQYQNWKMLKLLNLGKYMVNVRF